MPLNGTMNLHHLAVNSYPLTTPVTALNQSQSSGAANKVLYQQSAMAHNDFVQ